MWLEGWSLEAENDVVGDCMVAERWWAGAGVLTGAMLLMPLRMAQPQQGCV